MKLWGDRFGKESSEEAFQFSASLPFDRRLWKHDIRGSVAHAGMLGKCGIIPQAEAEQIIAGLKQIETDIQTALDRNEDPFDPQSEDIHTEIERKLTEKIGEVAGRLHTARSRNDQVALDLRLYLRDACDEIGKSLIRLQEALIAQAESHLKTETILPGYTHRQHAQPVLLSHHLLAYFWKFQRDRDRVCDCRRRINVSPLGAAALAGTSYPIDPALTAAELEFPCAFDNSMDAVSDRDFAVEFLAVAATCMSHLSSLAGELVLWSSAEFGFVILDDAWCTGSSIMPQKRNPDIAELVNGKAGRVLGHLVGLVSLLKGLPLTYNRDLQEDKEAVFDSHNTLCGSLGVMAGMLQNAAFQSGQMLEAVKASPFLAATEVADYLAKKRVPFRQAHSLTAKIVRSCEEKKKSLADLSLEEWKKFSPLFDADIEELLEVGAVVKAKASPGGTAPQEVTKAIMKAKQVMQAPREG
ncbi:MAG: argininosuccinate lyase [Armatimonadetes bacterium]|nr:argininosuccinate lyase [Armatimonadota bacterium]NIM23388.1 argininosuccinate lyase [Armatimonadota bacterium]NIM67253.1 argininosuccinate lyase [Armatimonadota bacterium]NIM75751.1 argininosuccinate lyase [Armatimonadota bacterium]NIN05439.1 argininosuccinate lyase [Armatimonadota bacterium]